MRILVLNVNTSQQMTATIAAAATRAASPGTQIVPLTPRFGPEAVDGAFESYVAAAGLMDAVQHHQGEYDAIVLAGFGEYGRDGLQELTTAPVIEICEASAYVAQLVGRTYSVVTTLQRSVSMIEDRLRLAGLAHRCASVRASGMSTAEVDADPSGAALAVLSQARLAVEGDFAEVVCLGCAGLAGVEDAIQVELGVPVVDGVGAAVRLAEAVVGLGLLTSKRWTYATPDPQRFVGWPLS